MKKKCAECGKPFETPKANRKYCSDVCAGKARRKRMNEAAKRYHEKVMTAFRKTV